MCNVFSELRVCGEGGYLSAHRKRSKKRVNGRVLCFACLIGGANSQKGLYDCWVKLSTCALPDHRDGFIDGQPLAIWPIRRYRVIAVGNRKDSRVKIDLCACQPFGITGPTQ